MKNCSVTKKEWLTLLLILFELVPIDSSTVLDPFCTLYNFNTLECMECEEFFEKNSYGRCLHCGIQQYYFNNHCQDASPLCETFDERSGWCLTCKDSTQDIVNGNCITISCGARQYHTAGVCHDVSPLCNTFDPSNGNCLTCASNTLVVVKG